MELILKIKLGNSAVLDGADVAELLRNSASDIEDYSSPQLKTMDPHKITDRNGNTVGSYYFKEN
jgi:hypothetical protein